MEELILISPSIDNKNAIMDYLKEFKDNNEVAHGTAGLDNAESFEAWLENVKINSSEDTVQEGLVPASTYLCIRKLDKALVGIIDIRHRLNDYLLQYGGHIGYSVRKSERQKGYATEMLRLALLKCKKLNISKALITCDKENIASAKTILNNKGIMENEVSENGGITKRFWIDLQ